MNAERKTCSDVLAEIKKITVFESTSRDASKKTAAADFRLLLNPYWDMGKGPLGDQIDLTIEIGLKYDKDATLKSAAQTIAVDTLMTELLAGNTTLYATFKARELDNGKQEPSSSNLRPAVTNSFIKFSNIIEQSANYTPNPAVLNLFIKMDELRKRYHALIPPKKDKGTTPSV